MCVLDHIPLCSALFLDEKAGTLKLSNLSSNMSGKYECLASNSAGTQACVINLEIISSMYHRIIRLIMIV